MPFTLTPIDAPAAASDSAEFDQAVVDCETLAASGKWATLNVSSEKEATAFKRKFGEAANRADKSRAFEPDVTNPDGTVTLKFSVKAKVVRAPRKPKTDVTVTDGTTPVPPTAS